MPTAKESSPQGSADPNVLARELELELIQKRAAWQRVRGRRGTWRALSVLFLLLVIFGILLAFFYFLPELKNREGQSARPPTSEADR